MLWSSLGALLILTGVLWRTWAMLYVGGRKSRTLVQTGPYSLSRHPLYFGTFLVGLGAGVMLQSITFVAAFLLLFPIIYLPVIQEEERVLHWNHPLDFEGYRMRVPHRFLPSLRSVEMGEPTLRVHVKAQWNQAKRGLLTLAAIPMLQLLLTLRSQGNLPVWFSLP
ncbi:MAG: methyltransferase family protein [Planctomycetota bacterium]